MMPTTTIVVCDSCTPAIVNDDWTHLDAAQDGTEETRDSIEAHHASITATLEVYGWLVHAGDADEGGYFECAVCSDIQCGGGARFSREAT